MKKPPRKSDPYERMLRKHWNAITGMYLAYEDRAPMIEYDVVSSQILAYPARDYLEDLTERTRDLAKKQYHKAVAEGALMVFVRDKAKRVLRSYVFPPTRWGGSARVNKKTAEPRAPARRRIARHFASGTPGRLSANDARARHAGGLEDSALRRRLLR